MRWYVKSAPIVSGHINTVSTSEKRRYTYQVFFDWLKTEKIDRKEAQLTVEVHPQLYRIPFSHRFSQALWRIGIWKKMADILQTTFSNAIFLKRYFSLMEILLKFVPILELTMNWIGLDWIFLTTTHVLKDILAVFRVDNESALVQVMAWRRTGAKPISESMVVLSVAHWPMANVTCYFMRQ